MALTERYFVSDSSIARTTSCGRISSPRTTYSSMNLGEHLRMLVSLFGRNMNFQSIEPDPFLSQD